MSMDSHEVELALDAAREYVLDHLINGGEFGRKRDASDIESYCNWAVDKMPEAMKEKLQPAIPDRELVKQAKKLTASVVPFLQSQRVPGSPKESPTWPLESRYTELAGTLRLISWEKLDVGECLRSVLEGSGEEMDSEEIADEYREIIEYRYKEAEKLSQNERIVRDANALMSKALTFVKDPEYLEPIKAASAEFKAYVKSLSEPQPEDALAR